MITFSDQQVATLMRVAGNLPADRRAEFLERISALLQIRLQMRGLDDPDDDDVEAAVNAALRGLVHESAA